MKTIKLILLTMLLSTALKAQTFKVTGFEADNERFKTLEKKVMGKQLVVEVYDTSVSMKLADKEPEIMHKVNGKENEYIMDLREKPSPQTFNMILRLNKTLGVTTSVELLFQADENGGENRHAHCKITAKRF